MSYGPVQTPVSVSFHQNFRQARDFWLHSVAQLSTLDIMPCKNGSEPHLLRGPQGEALASDYLWFGPEQASRLAVVISATHGVEGYTGSGIQSFLLAEFSQERLRLPPDTAIFFVHALNPWGMAWARRCDEQGIDLNRNFVDFQQPLPADANYLKVLAALKMPDIRQRRCQLKKLAQELGRESYEKAVSSGQYSDPSLPFFGGCSASFGRRLIERLIDVFHLRQRRLLVLDLHTGLGPWGYGELICDHPIGSSGEQFALSVFGPAICLPATGSSSSVPKHGLMDYAWHDIMGPGSCFLTLEFGSYPTQYLFDTIIEDHLFWDGLDATRADKDLAVTKTYAAQRTQMLRHFCPADKYWQQSVLFRARQVLQQSLEGLYP